MQPYIVHSEKANGPATHAVVIGVGAYRHLPGFNRPDYTSPHHDGMGQLYSPQPSALEFARWLLEDYVNPSKPIASLALLVSDENPVTFTNSKTDDTYNVAGANIAHIKGAVRNWRKLGDENEENLMLFFFSGHGVAQGPDTSLLLEDFAADDDNIFEGAIDFRKLYLGMKGKCKARQQIYFVDACRASNNTLFASNSYIGDPIILPERLDTEIRAPIFYSAVPGKKAYGRRGKPSYFTESLLKAFRGGGAHNMSEGWKVSTTHLYTALDVYMTHLHDSGKARRLLRSAAVNLENFDFIELADTPDTLVIVNCSDKDAMEEAVFTCSSDSGYSSERTQPEEAAWEPMVPVGDEYEFRAVFPASTYNAEAKRAKVWPPLKKVEIPVSK